MGMVKEYFVPEEKAERTAFDDFVVKFIVAFSGSTLLILCGLF
ncbi:MULTISPECIES: hypothetical protein [unclassified Fibrobacter]|nr:MULTISPECIES: hypothetical protein [unclassified Fibrobacter]SHK19683.1 hypothetical protein SAMN05720759_10155 [Fibrobacter sp. UWB12]SIO45077.1 hypothetical protein SAMN05720758_2995 [Fibrobacter sp. UWB11]